jgi:hypothetical protein
MDLYAYGDHHKVGQVSSAQASGSPRVIGKRVDIGQPGHPHDATQLAKAMI